MAVTVDDYQAKQRILALQDAGDLVGRAASAAAAATCGEADALKEAVLQGIQQRPCWLLAQLQALA